MDIDHPQPLPTHVAAMLRVLDAVPRLLADLTLVHDAAVQLLSAMRQRWPLLDCDDQAVLFGAAPQDIGKIAYPEELTGPGSQHEEAGVFLLWELGVSIWLAHFAWVHGQWRAVPHPLLDDLLVPLADTVWCGRRDVDQEYLVDAAIGAALRCDPGRSSPSSTRSLSQSQHWANSDWHCRRSSRSRMKCDCICRSRLVYCRQRRIRFNAFIAATGSASGAVAPGHPLI